MLTREWVQGHGISGDPTPPAVPDYNEPCARTAREIALRALALQGVVAVASGVDPTPVIQWFHQQQVWDAVTPDEIAFLANQSPTEKERNRFVWHKEAEWALLWVVGKVEYLGLPAGECDSARLIDEIIPGLGSDMEDFLSSAHLRPAGVLLAEDDRTYNMQCYAQPARREGVLPEDRIWSVLYERRYAFEWLDGSEHWDEVTCDAQPSAAADPARVGAVVE
jgi:hypothetical protein